MIKSTWSVGWDQKVYLKCDHVILVESLMRPLHAEGAHNINILRVRESLLLALGGRPWKGHHIPSPLHAMPPWPDLGPGCSWPVCPVLSVPIVLCILEVSAG